jgi:hypothetical protein
MEKEARAKPESLFLEAKEKISKVEIAKKVGAYHSLVMGWR